MLFLTIKSFVLVVAKLVLPLTETSLVTFKSLLTLQLLISKLSKSLLLEINFHELTLLSHNNCGLLFESFSISIPAVKLLGALLV